MPLSVSAPIICLFQIKTPIWLWPKQEGFIYVLFMYVWVVFFNYLFIF